MIRWRSFRPLLLALLLAPGGETLAAQPTGGDTAFETAPVIIDGRTLFTVRGTESYPAEQRAALIAERIRELARNPGFNPGELIVEEHAGESRIVAGRVPVVRLFDADADIEGVERQVIAELSLQRIREAIAAYRAARTREALLASAWQIGLATLLALAAIVVLRRLFRVLDRRVSNHLAARAKGISLRAYDLVKTDRVWSLMRGALRLLGGLVFVVIASVYVAFVLARLPWTKGAAAQLGDWILAPLASLGRGAVEKAPDLIFLVILFVVTRWALRLIRVVFAAIGRGDLQFEGFDTEWAEPTYNIVRLAVVAFALMVAYPYVPGSSSDAFKGVSLFLGVMFSIGSSTAISNVIAGYTLIYRRAFKEGDVVRIGEVFGVVARRRLQATHLRTIKNEDVVVPNSTILNSEVINYTTLAGTDGLILHTTVGIGYEAPWRQVEAMLLEAALRTSGALKQPEPFVHQLALGDFAVTYEINVYTDQPLKMRKTYTELHRHILDLFNEYGVQIMTPAYEGDPETPKVVSREKWHMAPAPPPRGDAP